MKEIDILIIGAGVAGLSASIYAKRSACSLVLLEKNAPGGKLLNIHRIDNYPGFKAASGPSIAQATLEQAMDLGVDYQYGNVMKISKAENEDFFVYTDVENYQAKAVIIASGSSNKKSGFKGEDTYFGKGISYCATCDGNFFKGKPMAVFGNNNKAVEEALYLAGLASELYFFLNGDLEADETYWNSLLACPNLKLIKGESLVEAKGEGKLHEIITQKAGQENHYEVEALFPFFGEVSSNQFLSSLGVETQNGFLKCNANMETNVPGLFGAGDIVDKKLRQIVTAASDGAIAATMAIAYVNAKKKHAQTNQ